MSTSKLGAYAVVFAVLCASPSAAFADTISCSSAFSNIESMANDSDVHVYADVSVLYSDGTSDDGYAVIVDPAYYVPYYQPCAGLSCVEINSDYSYYDLNYVNLRKTEYLNSDSVSISINTTSYSESGAPVTCIQEGAETTLTGSDINATWSVTYYPVPSN